MRNFTMPKTITKWCDSHPEIVESYHLEEDGMGESEGQPIGIWVYFKYGYINVGTETHMIHESTVKAFLEQVENIEPCRCEECVNHMSAKS